MPPNVNVYVTLQLQEVRTEMEQVWMSDNFKVLPYEKDTNNILKQSWQQNPKLLVMLH